MKGTSRKAAVDAKWRRRRRTAAVVLAFVLPLPLIFLPSHTTLATLVVALLVGLGAGLLTAPFWAEDRLAVWLPANVERRSTREGARQWLHDHPGGADDSTVGALLAASQYPEAAAMLSMLPPVTNETQTFFRRWASAVIDVRRDAAVDLDGLWSLAGAQPNVAARVMAQAQVANLGLTFALRGGGDWPEALRRVRAIGSSLQLSASQRLRLWFMHFPGLAIVLIVLATWALGLPMGYSRIT